MSKHNCATRETPHLSQTATPRPLSSPRNYDTKQIRAFHNIPKHIAWIVHRFEPHPSLRQMKISSSALLRRPPTTFASSLPFFHATTHATAKATTRADAKTAPTNIAIPPEP